MEKKAGGISKETTVLRRSFPLTPNTPRLTKKHHGPTPKPTPPKFFTLEGGEPGLAPTPQHPVPKPREAQRHEKPGQGVSGRRGL